MSFFVVGVVGGYFSSPNFLATDDALSDDVLCAKTTLQRASVAKSATRRSPHGFVDDSDDQGGNRRRDVAISEVTILEL